MCKKQLSKHLSLFGPELVIQIGKSLETYGKYYLLRHFDLWYASEVRQPCPKTIHMVVATRRLIDNAKKAIRLSQRTLCADEADRMMDMGFLPDLEHNE